MNKNYYSSLDKKIANARKRRQVQEYKNAIVNTIEFMAIVGAVTITLFLAWLTLGIMFRTF